MKITDTTLAEVKLIEPDVYRDGRGYVFESYQQQKYADAGISDRFLQDNQSRSAHGTLRGLHAQFSRPQAKLIRVLEGEIYDVSVDIRRGSPTFKRWFG